MKINVYGCSEYPLGYPMVSNISEFTCDNNSPMGWVAVVFMVVTIIVGGLVLPSVLVGIVSISFEQSWNQYAEEVVKNSMLDLIVSQISAELPNWWSEDRLLLMKMVYQMLDHDNQGSLDVGEVKKKDSFDGIGCVLVQDH